MTREIDTSMIDQAICFAVKAHAGIARKGKKLPYIVHPLEAITIVATMTDDQELLAAAALHDILEDTDTTAEQISDLFGERVAKLVTFESDMPMEGNKSDTWHNRKRLTIDRLASADLDVKIVALGDKLSNMRAIARDYAEIGDALWNRFHIKEKSEHAWHYLGLADSLAALGYTAAYQEFSTLVKQVFG